MPTLKSVRLIQYFKRKSSTTEVMLMSILECWLVIIFMRTKCFDNNITQPCVDDELFFPTTLITVVEWGWVIYQKNETGTKPT